jgi:Na+/phosphate symporter
MSKFKAKINERNFNLQPFLIGKAQLSQFNEAQWNTLKAYFNVEIENMRKRITKLSEEKKELIAKCSQYEEHIKLLESTVKLYLYCEYKQI